MNGDLEYENTTTLDPEEAYSIIFWDELIPILVVYGITLVLGLSGNCLIIFTTIRYRRMQSVTNIFLSSLASSDLLLIVFCIPVKVAKLFSYTWEMGAFVCKIVHYIQNLSAICSVLTLTVISIERYYAIIHPIEAKTVCTVKKARRIILIIWIASLILACPTLIAQIHLPVGPHEEYFWCVKNWDDNILWRVHEIYMLVLILVGPFCVMTFSYSLICCELCRIVERRSMMTSEHVFAKHSMQDYKYGENFRMTEYLRPRVECARNDSLMVRQVIHMLVAVVLLFALCWTPLLVVNAIMSFGVLPSAPTGLLKNFWTAFHLMAYANSCINPIIYGFMSKSFRESFKRTLRCGRFKRNYPNRIESYSFRNNSRTCSQTRNTSVK